MGIYNQNNGEGRSVGFVALSTIIHASLVAAIVYNQPNLIKPLELGNPDIQTVEIEMNEGSQTQSLNTSTQDKDEAPISKEEIQAPVVKAEPIPEEPKVVEPVAVEKPVEEKIVAPVLPVKKTTKVKKSAAKPAKKAKPVAQKKVKPTALPTKKAVAEVAQPEISDEDSVVVAPDVKPDLDQEAKLYAENVDESLSENEELLAPPAFEDTPTEQTTNLEELMQEEATLPAPEIMEEPQDISKLDELATPNEPELIDEMPLEKEVAKQPIQEKASQAAAPIATESAATNAQKGSQSSSEAYGVPTGVRQLGDLKQRPGNRPPTYDRMDRYHKREGQTSFMAYVTRDGRLTNFKMLKSSGHQTLDSRTLQAIQNWRFDGGQEGWVELPFNWQLKGGPQQMPSGLRRNYSTN